MELKATSTTLILLFIAALLETGGDALIRTGLRAPTLFLRTLFFAAGAVVLFTYGFVVNVPSWDFGRLLGIYLVFFFVLAQMISWIVFHQQPSRGIFLGGAFIVAGGVIISFNP